MNFQIFVFAFLLSLSISLFLNAFLYFKLIQSKKSPQLTIDAKQLLHDIMGGSAILRITVIDPGDILLKSPRS